MNEYRKHLFVKAMGHKTWFLGLAVHLGACTQDEQYLATPPMALPVLHLCLLCTMVNTTLNSPGPPLLSLDPSIQSPTNPVFVSPRHIKSHQIHKSLEFVVNKLS